ncbi:zinc carboxypeptidase, putative [Leishmania panamensis]|uniref:Zinc carboxypeptidase, putative n=1 Tax=Leishmania panamensis TaxID=5679 RepID=A0A088S2B8_LEIPA|nr:zinc carboxypeptidase, putative [Leishmania panamensis]AIO02548.1 zinc carboxypeptidase, putative [Leishmania panamensis]
MSRSQDVKRKAAYPPPPAYATLRTNVPSFSALQTSARVNAAGGLDGSGTPRQRQRAAERLLLQQQLQAEGVVKAKSDVHSNYGHHGRDSAVFMVAANDARSRVSHPTPGLSNSESILPSAARPASVSSTLPFGLASVAVQKVKVPEGYGSNQPPTSQPLRRTSMARITSLRPPARLHAHSPPVVAPKVGPRDSLASGVTTPGRVYAASTSPPLSASAEAASAREAHPCDASVPRRNRNRDALLATGISPRPHSGVAVQGSSINSCSSQRSLQHDTPSFITVARHRPNMAPVMLPTQQLLESGYYVASDESANSSFSDTPQSARRISLTSSFSLRTTTQRLDVNSGGAVGEGRSATVATGASLPGVRSLRDSRDPNSSARGGCSDDNSDSRFEEEKDVGNFDEENEEQAVLTYMDSGVEGSRASGPPSSNKAPPPPLARQGALPADKIGNGTGGNLGDFNVSVEVGDTDYDIGEDPRSCMSASSTLQLHRRSTSSQRNVTYSVRDSAAADWNTPTQTHQPISSSKASGAPPRTTAVAPTKSTAATAVSSMLSQQHSTGHAPLGPTPSQHFVSCSSHLQSSSTYEEELRERECKQLSLHEAFFLNRSRSMWLVDDHVLAKVLEYVRIMGYEHPALKHDRSKGQPSLWSSSSAIDSPIVLGKPKKATSASSPLVVGTRKVNPQVTQDMHKSPSSATAVVTEEALAQSSSANTPFTLPTAAGGASESAAFVTTQFYLKAGKPRCAGQYVKTSKAAAATHLFLTFSEAMRWIAEQEYVIGTVLLCCARFIGDANTDGAATTGDTVVDTAARHQRRTMLQRRKPCIPLRLHPIHFVASLVCSWFPQWGGISAFARAWETQIRLVLGSASPSHQRFFKCSDDGLLLSSDCEGGNLYRVERTTEPYLFLIWLEPDQGSDKRIWFYFSVVGAKEGRRLRFRLMNAAPHVKLYRQNGMMPVWRDGLSQPNWGPVDSCSFRTTNRDLDGEVSFSVTARNSTETIQIAFCAPYTYANLLCHICHWHALVKSSACDMRFEERVLCRSPEGRKLHLLIVTSRSSCVPASAATEDKKSTADATVSGSQGDAGQSGDGLVTTGGSSSSDWTSPAIGSPTTTTPSGKGKGGAAKEAVRGPYANFASGKKVVLVSGRVHPGEVTASHGVHGLISFLLSSDARAIQLREHFIFFIVPMLNPDGVSRGHSRMDQFGNNLNRCYNDPDAETQPTVLALRRVFEHLQQAYRERFIMYLDFHSHASQSSGFIFGNNLPVSVQHWNLFFPRLVELHARHVFAFSLCRFGRVHMTTKDGTSRVLFGSSLIHSYTVELTHFTDRRLYADDFTAMNNGSNVLFEVTWPPLHRSAGQACPADEDADGAQAATNGAAERSGISTPSCARGVGKWSGSSFPGRGRTCRSSSEGAVAYPTSGSLPRQCPGAAAGSHKHGGWTRVGEHRSGQSSASQTGSAIPPLFLQPISTPTILCQSAEVGQACLLALRDYCSIGARPSPELTMVGGMEAVLRDSKRQVKQDSSKGKKSQSTTTYARMQPIYRQY